MTSTAKALGAANRPQWTRPEEVGRPPLIPPPSWGIDPMGDNMPQEDFHAVMSITLGELMKWGLIVWGEPEWTWDYYDEKQYWRMSQKIEQHYWYREIGILPPGQWRMEFIRTMNEIMPKYKLMYRALDDAASNGTDVLMRTGTTYGKGRNVGSTFPATQIRENSDYASDATDNQYETQVEGNYLDQADRLSEYRDTDLRIINELERLFSSLLTASMNSGFGL